MKKFFALSVLALLMVAVGVGCCACRKGVNNKSLTAQKWHLVKMMERELKIEPDQFLFSFEQGGKFAGMAACNTLMGEYQITERGDMKFSDMASTRRMCREAELERQFQEILGRTTHYEIDGDMLMLLSNGEVQVILQAK